MKHLDRVWLIHHFYEGRITFKDERKGLESEENLKHKLENTDVLALIKGTCYDGGVFLR